VPVDVASAAFVGLLKLAAQAQPAGVVVVIDLTSDRLPRRPRADAECSLSSNAGAVFMPAASVLPYSGAGASRSILMVRLVRSAYLG
jgi:hypothetical protein